MTCQERLEKEYVESVVKDMKMIMRFKKEIMRIRKELFEAKREIRALEKRLDERDYHEGELALEEMDRVREEERLKGLYENRWFE